MRCDICEEEKEGLIPFYWGFFKTEYEPEKWIMACPDCCREFQRASFGYSYDRTPLIEMEKNIENNVKKKVRKR